MDDFYKGVSFWEGVNEIHDESILTSTVEVSDTKEQFVILDNLMKETGEHSLFEWRTLGYPIKGGRIQKIKVKKEIFKRYGGLEYFDESNDIYSYLSSLDLSEKIIDSGKFIQPLFSVLIVASCNANILSIWDDLKTKKILNEKTILDTFNNEDVISIIRLPVRDYSGAIQVITRKTEQ